MPALRSAIALAAPVCWTVPALAPIVPPVAHAMRIRRRIGDAGAAAVTFDDGPHPAGTPAVLAVLAERRALATFFLVGEQVDRDPGLAREIVARGHTVAVHGYRHRNHLRLTPGMLTDDVSRGRDAVARATGLAPWLYRPPYGIVSPVSQAVVGRQGLRMLLWSRWGHDWRAEATAASIAAEVTRNLTTGDVLLLHDADHYSDAGSWRATAAALPAVLDEIERAGLRPIAL